MNEAVEEFNSFYGGVYYIYASQEKNTIKHLRFDFMSSLIFTYEGR